MAVVLSSALALAVLAWLDTLLTAVIAEVETSARHDARRELVVVLNLVITLVEVTGGLLAGSLSDALHNLSDRVAVVIAWIAVAPAGAPTASWSWVWAAIRCTAPASRKRPMIRVPTAGAELAMAWRSGTDAGRLGRRRH